MLKEYQKKTLDKIVNELASGANKVLVNLPTGAARDILRICKGTKTCGIIYIEHYIV